LGSSPTRSKSTSANMSRPSAETSHPLALAYPVTVHRDPFPAMRLERRNDSV
jgi:hypothetical protein